MPDERTRTEQYNSASLPPPHADSEMEQPGLYERFLNWAAELPWWAIILAVVAVMVLYSMLTSITYRRVIQFLTDDPQVSTQDKFNAVLIVGEPITVEGVLEGETADSVKTVIAGLVQRETHSGLRSASGVVLDESAARLTLRTAEGLVTVPRKDITSRETLPSGEVRVTYAVTRTVTGVVTDINDARMTIRTVNPQEITFAPSRILSRETIQTVTCAAEDPHCTPGEIITIRRQGETISGELRALSDTGMKVAVGGEVKDIRLRDVEYYSVVAFSEAVSPDAAGRTLADGDRVRVGYFAAPGIEEYLGTLGQNPLVDVPLTFAAGSVEVELVRYESVEALLQATADNAVDGMLYFALGPQHAEIDAWNAQAAGAALEVGTFACNRGCEIQVKLVDDEVTGRVAEESDTAITLVTTEAEFVTIARDTVREERKLEPAVCALNNLRGCDAGIFLTIRVTLQAYGLALVIGLIVGIMRVQTAAITLRAKILQTFFRSFSTLYVEVVRGIPLLVILLYAGFVVSPELRDTFGINLNDESEAIIGLAFGYGAFVAEIFRAGIQSISRGQMEAARSLGMSYPQAMRYVVLPQAIRVVLPPLGNDFISMLKDSALISVLALPDLLQLGRLYVSRTFRAFEGYNTVAVLYLLMTLFLSMTVRIIERRSRLPG